MTATTFWPSCRKGADRACRTLRGMVLLLGAGAMLAACEHPIAVVTPHVEAADLLLRDSLGATLARTEFNRRWSVDSLWLRDGQPLRVSIIPIDFRGGLVDISGRTDVSFRMEAEDGSLVQWEPQRGFGWVRPFAVGATRVRFLIWHETHADFVTPWIAVRVMPALTTATIHEARPASHGAQELLP